MAYDTQKVARIVLGILSEISYQVNGLNYRELPILLTEEKLKNPEFEKAINQIAVTLLELFPSFGESTSGESAVGNPVPVLATQS